jgi:anti-sigma factor RsiW
MTADACRHDTDRLVDYVDDTLSNDRRTAVEGHLSHCAACRALVGRLRESLELAQVVWNDAADGPYLTGHSFPVTRQPETARPRRIVSAVVRCGAAAAALAAGVLLIVAWRSSLEPSRVVAPAPRRIARAQPTPAIEPQVPAVADADPHFDAESLLRHHEQAARLRAAVRILETIPELAVVERRARSYLDAHYADTGR